MDHLPAVLAGVVEASIVQVDLHSTLSLSLFCNGAQFFHQKNAETRHAVATPKVPSFHSKIHRLCRFATKLCQILSVKWVPFWRISVQVGQILFKWVLKKGADWECCSDCTNRNIQWTVSRPCPPLFSQWSFEALEQWRELTSRAWSTRRYQHQIPRFHCWPSRNSVCKNHVYNCLYP